MTGQEAFYTAMTTGLKRVRFRIYDDMEEHKAARIALAYADIAREDLSLYRGEFIDAEYHIMDVRPDSWGH